MSGTARGCGWQKIGAVVNLGAYYVLGVPTALLMGFVYHLGGKVSLYITSLSHHNSLICLRLKIACQMLYQGLWMGITVAVFSQSLALLIITICTDWNKEVKHKSLQ